MFADLHIHTRASDGTYAVHEIMALARHYGFQAMAITDHDTVEACAQAANLCAEYGIEFLSGTELTADWRRQEIHILAYHIETEHPELLSALALFQARRQERLREMIARLNGLKIPLEMQTVLALADCRSPGRLHVGRALVQGGFCSSLEEAFARFLKKHRPAWAPKYKIDAMAVIDLVHRAGGLAVMAHPGLSHCDDLIPELVSGGLDGLECYHSKHLPADTLRYVKLARAQGLLITGGSDCHGMSKGQPTLGQVKLPYDCFEALKAKAANRQTSINAIH